MVDVFFKGLGSWFAWGEEGASVIVPSYVANGVFSLNVSDEITYNHTGNLPLNVSTLHPTNHPDSEFSRLENLGKTLKIGGLGDIGGKYTENNCFFVIDEGQPRDKILVIASPYQAIPEAEAVGNNILSKQPAYLKNWINKGLDKHLTHFEIAELWATPERKHNDVKHYEALINQAVEDGDLLAEVSIRNPKALGGFEVIDYSPTTLRQAHNGFLNGGYLQFTIHRDTFREWLIKSNQWPIADDCLLAKWWPQIEQQTEVVGVSDVSHAANEPSSKKVAPVFSEFKNLRANEIKLVMMENETAKIVIRGKTIKVNPDELSLKAGSQGWKLLEGAAVNQGDLASALKRLNSSSNLEAEKGKIKTAVNRLRTSLVGAMGLEDNPINYTKDNGYKFTFKTMTHEILKDDNVSKGSDAMDYVDSESFDDNQHGNNDFWRDDE